MAGVSSSALRQPGFAQLWAGEALSQFGWQFTGLAVPVIAVNLLHASDAEMGYLNAANTIAFLAIGLVAGGLVDRWRKRRVMIVTDLIRAAVVLSVPLMFAFGQPQMWHFYFVAMALGFATVFFDIAYQSYIPVLVESDAVGDANAKLETTAQIARLGGPGLAGLLLRVVSAPVLMLVNAVGFLASAGFLSTIRDSETPVPRSKRPPLMKEIGEGISFVWQQHFLRRVTMTTALSNLGATIIFTLEPILVLRMLGVTPFWYGVIASVGAIGGLLASLVTTRLSDRIGQGQALVLAMLISGAGMALLPLAVLVPTGWAIPVLMVQSFLVAFAVIVYNVLQVTARQRLCPTPLLGRMNASIRFVVWGIMPISALLAGLLGSALGTVGAIWVGVALAAAACLPLLLSRYARMRELPTSPE